MLLFPLHRWKTESQGTKTVIVESNLYSKSELFVPNDIGTKMLECLKLNPAGHCAVQQKLTEHCE